MRTENQWIIALRDCGLMRVTFDADVLLGMIDHGYVDFRPVPENEDPLDVWLTKQGHIRATRLTQPERVASLAPTSARGSSPGGTLPPAGAATCFVHAGEVSHA